MGKRNNMKNLLRTISITLIGLGLSSTLYAAEPALLTPTGNATDIPTASNTKAVAAKVTPAKPKTVVGSVNGGGCSALSGNGLQRKAGEHADSIGKYSQRYGVDADIIKAVIAVESCYNPYAVSPKGAQGLMQLIPETAARFGVANSFDSSENIHGGTRYLSWLMKRYDGDLNKAIAAYNAGEGAVDKYQGIPPYDETQHYVQRVLTVYSRLSGAPVSLPVVRASNRMGNKAAVGVIPVALHQTEQGRVSMTYEPPKIGTAKPGRSGWQANRALAPQLYKQ